MKKYKKTNLNVKFIFLFKEKTSLKIKKQPINRFI